MKANILDLHFLSSHKKTARRLEILLQTLKAQHEQITGIAQQFVKAEKDLARRLKIIDDNLQETEDTIEKLHDRAAQGEERISQLYEMIVAKETSVARVLQNIADENVAINQRLDEQDLKNQDIGTIIDVILGINQQKLLIEDELSEGLKKAQIDIENLYENLAKSAMVLKEKNLTPKKIGVETDDFNKETI